MRMQKIIAMGFVAICTKSKMSILISFRRDFTVVQQTIGLGFMDNLIALNGVNLSVTKKRRNKRILGERWDTCAVFVYFWLDCMSAPLRSILWGGKGRIWGCAGGVPWHNWSPLRG